MKLYRFDGVDERFDLVPLGARRALDRAGVRLSLEGWRSLTLSARRLITEAGSDASVDVARVWQATRAAQPAADPIEPVSEPPSDATPRELRQAFAPVGPLDDALWVSLSALDRYALAKVAERGRAERVAGAYEEIVGQSAVSTHLAASGGARMVDVAPKPPTLRRAVAESRVSLGAEAYARLARGDAPKGDVLGTARLAGILAAKRTPEVVPLCHPVALTHVEIDLRIDPKERAVAVQATVEAFDRTGVEMEALLAASAAALTVYDMLKAFDRSMEIGPTRLVAKSGGRSGDFQR